MIIWKQGMLSQAFLCTYIHSLFLVNKCISNYPILLTLVSSASEAISSLRYTNLCIIIMITFGYWLALQEEPQFHMIPFPSICLIHRPISL